MITVKMNLVQKLLKYLKHLWVFNVTELIFSNFSLKQKLANHRKIVRNLNDMGWEDFGAFQELHIGTLNLYFLDHVEDAITDVSEIENLSWELYETARK